MVSEIQLRLNINFTNLSGNLGFVIYGFTISLTFLAILALSYMALPLETCKHHKVQLRTSATLQTKTDGNILMVLHKGNI